jgi:isochorismate pyruvate lyase
MPGTALTTRLWRRQGTRFTRRAGPIARGPLSDLRAKRKCHGWLAKRGALGQTPSMTEILSPEDCMTLAEVRVGVDATDRALCALLATRFGYMRAAARIKTERGQVRDEGRKAQVIDHVAAEARALGWPEQAARDTWEALVEASIAYELDRWDERQG